MRVQSWMVVGLATAMVLGGCGKSKEQKQAEQAVKELQKLGKEMSKGAAQGGGEMGDAIAALQKMAASGEKKELVDFRELKALLPEKLPGMKRTNASGEKSGAFGMSMAMAQGRYEGEDGASIDVEVSDIGGMGGMASLAQMGWAAAEIDRETETGYEKTTTLAGQKAHEEYNRESKSGSLEVLVASRFMVKIEGDNVDMATIKKAADALNINKLAAMAK